MNENNVAINSPKAWFLAARPKTLSGAAVPVMIASALAWADFGSELRLVPMVLCFFFAFVMQIDANFVNDYYDFIRGNDDGDRLGPKRACAQGWITTKAMRTGIAATTVAACGIGLPLIAFGGCQMLAVGALCVLFCFLYTTCLSYIGLGDLLVLVFFGLVPVGVSYYLIAPTYAGLPGTNVWLAAAACGLVIDTLLIVNNYRDIEGDRKAGKKTLVVRIGKKPSELLYLLLGLAAYAIDAVVFGQGHPAVMLFPAIYIILHAATYKRMVAIGEGRELNKTLGMTARNIFIFGLLTSLGLIV